MENIIELVATVYALKVTIGFVAAVIIGFVAVIVDRFTPRYLGKKN